MKKFLKQNLHCTVGVQLLTAPCLKNFVEALVGHCPADQQLAGPDVVQGEGLYLGYVDAHLPVDTRALDAHNDAIVCRQPCHVLLATTITALVV